jgi:hypothetical protein
MLDEIKTTQINYNGKKITLTPDFKAFRKLNKITGNAFKTISDFVTDTEKRLENLPAIIQAMADQELDIEEIENNILGMQWGRVEVMASIIIDLLDKELIDQASVEEHLKNVEEIPSLEVGKKN